MSSSIIFVSNQKSERRNNKINDFEIDIKPEIDARSGKKEIIVDEILYPNTISSIHPRNKEEFKFKFKLSVERFFKHKTSGFIYSNSKFTSEHDWIYIPYGHHSLKNLLVFINKYLCKVNCGVKKVMGQKCAISCNKNMFTYSTGTSDGHENNVYMEKLKNRHLEKDQFDLKIEITFSPELVHVLGIMDNVITFAFKHSNSTTPDILEYKGLYVIDPSYGLNFMSITCDQIVPVKMGFEFKERLLLCPFELPNEDIDKMTISFDPKNCVQLLRPGVVRSMHFVVEDLNGEKIYFNGGKIVLICSIV